jgi:transcriptional regulator with XRE-family HTH domain
MEDAVFGQVLRAYREAAGLTQEELGEVTDLHRTYISLLERGINSPSLRTLTKLSRALGVTLTEMASAFEQALAVHPEDRPAVVDLGDDPGQLPAVGRMA